MVKEFVTALKEATEPESDEGYAFTVDGHECHAYKPEDAQLAMLLASVSRHNNWTTQVAGIINFFVEVLDDESHSYITERLLDRKDPFGLGEVQDIIEWMTEEWTGRPTRSPSVSTRSQRSGGRKSTQPISVST